MPTSVGEKICKKVIEKLTGCKFKKVRPEFLKNPKTGRCLEIDCYNDKLKLGVEYNGMQHYIFVPQYHKSKEDYQQQVYRDKLKAKLCKRNNIKLITVKYDVEDIEQYITKEYSKINRKCNII